MLVQRPSVFEELKKVDALVDQQNEPEMVVERLPFTVRVVHNEVDLAKAVHVRHAAYARHMPELARLLVSPEVDDTQDDTVVLLAESKLDSSPLGTVRIQSNIRRPLSLERWATLPGWLQERSRAHVSRLAIGQGTIGRLVKMILVKASFQYCEKNGIEWAVVAARPPLDKSYRQLMFSDVMPGETFVPLPRSKNVPHQVMAFEIETGNARWTAAAHPLLNFFSYTHHPDIDVGVNSAVGGDLRPFAHRIQPFSNTHRSAHM